MIVLAQAETELFFTQWAGWGLVACGLIALLLPLSLVFRHWQHRRRVWFDSPERLLDPPPRPPLYFALSLLLAGLIGVSAMLLPDLRQAPLALVLAAAGAFTVVHLTAWTLAGYVALGALGLALVTAGAAWLVPHATGAVLGTAIAGVLFLWLAGFWSQQLAEGTAWTTAGRLIPVCRSLAHVAAGLVLVLVVGLWLLSMYSPVHADLSHAAQFGARWLIVITLLPLLLFMLLLVRTGAAQRRALTGLAACSVGIGLAGMTPMLVNDDGRAFLTGIFALAGVGLVLGLRARLAGVSGYQGLPYNVVLTAIALVVVGLGLGAGGWSVIGAATAAAIALLAAWWWPQRNGGVRPQREWT
jgi:hypothetical protein